MVSFAILFTDFWLIPALNEYTVSLLQNVPYDTVCSFKKNKYSQIQ